VEEANRCSPDLVGWVEEMEDPDRGEGDEGPNLFLPVTMSMAARKPKRTVMTTTAVTSPK
jgi:hypothetical protein